MQHKRPDYNAKTRLWVGVGLRAAGDRKRLADKLGCSYPCIGLWLAGATTIHRRYCAALAELCHIPPAEIRPDVFGG